ncbi:MAG: Na/Pi cotransporter family protein [Magnetococcales bacterium]|nr:Na/Pi cotransporter family protein [Magnetococcales bacterium]
MNGLMVMHFFSGLALYLFGMEKLRFALKSLLDGPAKTRLGALLDHPMHGLGFGVVTGAMLLSTKSGLEVFLNLTSLNLLTFSQTLPLLSGLAIGTTLLTQIMAFLTTAHVGLPMIIGLLLIYTTSHSQVRLIGHLLLGLGLLFFGLFTMSQAPMVLQMVQTVLSNGWFGVPLIFFLTALFGSTNATMGLLLLLTFQDLLPLTMGITLTLTAYFGTAMRFLLDIRGKPRMALRLVIGHTLFIGMGILMTVWWIPQLAAFFALFTPIVSLQLALFHTLFNVCVAVVFLPMSGWIAQACIWIAPDEYSMENQSNQFNNRYWPKYLDDDLIITPSLALAMARREVHLISALLEEMLNLVPESLFQGDAQKIAKLRKMDDRVDEIHQAITQYLAKTNSGTLTSTVTDELLAIMTVTNELESIGDIIENNLAHLAEVCIQEQIRLSSEIELSINAYHQTVHLALRQVSAAFLSDNRTLAAQVMAMKDEISDLDAKCRLKQMHSLQNVGQGEENFAVYSLQMDIYENFKRIYYHTKRIAKVVAGV